MGLGTRGKREVLSVFALEHVALLLNEAILVCP